MDIRTLAERELSELPLFDMTEWLARKGEYDPSFRLVASEFGVITTLLDHGYYEEASERIAPLLGMKVPAAFHRLGLALEVKANGKSGQAPLSFVLVGCHPTFGFSRMATGVQVR